MKGLGSGHVTCREDLSNPRRCLLHRGHTDRQTDGYRDSMTESAQWADSVKRAWVSLGGGKRKHILTELFQFKAKFKH